MFTVLIAHPYEKSFCHAVKREIESQLKKDGEDFQVIDLYQDGFNPVMSEKDLQLYSQGESSDPMVQSYLDMLEKTETLFVVFPIWWGSMPAILKGFLDKVFLPKKAFIPKKSGLIKGKFSQISKAYVFNTMGGPALYHNKILKFPIKRIFVKTGLEAIGVKSSDIIQFDSMKSRSDKHREQWLLRVRSIVQKSIQAHRK